MEDTPRLRHVEAFPVEHEGQRYVGLRDPAGYTAAVLIFPAPLVEMLALFDGDHSIVDMQAELMRRHGELVTRERIEQLAASLDEHGFLDSASFARHRATVDGEFLQAARRPAAHAGGAYPGEPGDLRRTMDGFFTDPAGPGAIDPAAPLAPAVQGIIAPHIDFHRGGPAYAWAYRDVAERGDADLFLVLGTCHAGMGHPFALTRKDHETPLGPAPVDLDFIDALSRRVSLDCFGSELAHRQEHSIEFQAVFLRYLFGGRKDFTIVPILTSFAHEALGAGRRPCDDPRVREFLDALRDAVATSGRRMAVIAGADLAHMGPRFGDPAPVSPAELARIEREDRAMLEAVEAGDPEGFFSAVAADGDRRRICGLSPIYTLLGLVQGRPGTLRHYGRWPDPQGVVSYASVVF
jgi:AmmeMemoRadiSam system protein B